MPVLTLAIAQAGYESIAGTAVPATRVIDMEPGSVSLDEGAEAIIVHVAGSYATGHKAYPGARHAAVSFKKLPWSYDDAPWWLNLFATPVTAGVGAGADKTWTQKPNDAADDKKRATIELGGKDTWPTEFQVSGCTGKKLALQIRQNDVWRADVDLLGLVVKKQAKTAALSARSVTHVEGSGTKVYVDTTTFGTTEIVGRVVSADVTIEDGVVDRNTLDGNATGGDLYAPAKTALVEARKVSAKVVAEFSATTEYDDFRAANIKKLRLVRTGAVLGGSNYRAQLDIAGAWRTFAMGDDNGLITAELELSALYDTGLAADWQAVHVNGLAALA